MKKEKIILSFIATLLGLLAAGLAFYFFQASKTIEPSNTKIAEAVSPSPTLSPSNFLTVDRPKDEDVVNNKILIISGKTASNAVVVVITDSSEDVITPALNGDFTTTATIHDDQNVIEIISISPKGESVAIKKTVTYSLEEF